MANVLIIDDDEHITRLLETHLTEEGHQVTVTHDGQDGLAQAERSSPDLIMLDVFLPDATGYQMCNRLRKNESTKTTPIIMMTGAARFPNQQMYGRQRGANEYIFKPFNIVEVGELVHKYIKPAPHNGVPKTSEPAPENGHQLETLDAYGQPARKPVISISVEKPPMIQAIPLVRSVPVEPLPAPAPAPIAVQPLPPAPAPAAAPVVIEEAGSAVDFTEKDRFTQFGMDIYALASRMTSSNAEKYLADQLLRTSLNAGARLQESGHSESRKESLLLIQQALKDLRETGYWLMLTKKAGLLEALGKTEVENACHSLTTLLVDFLNTEKKSK